MKLFQQTLAWLLVFQLSGAPVLFAQPVIITPGNPFGNQSAIGNGIENLRVTRQSPDGTEAQLTMDYSYDGFSGPIAQVLPMIGKKGQKGVSAWFGADPVTVGRGRGTITLRVRFFNDEPDVPAMFTSDQIQILILNQSGTARLAIVPFLKNINWGSPGGAAGRQPAKATPPPLARVDSATAQKVADEKRMAEERARQEAATREKARLLAEAEVKARKEAENQARAEAQARSEALQKAKAETERLARESQKAEELRLAQQKAREEEQRRAEAVEVARREAEAKALADAKAREEAQKRADAENKRISEERRLAEAKRVAEEKARQEARLKNQAEQKRLADLEQQRLAEEKRRAEEKVLAETKARKEAEDKAWQEALAQAKAELAAKKLAEEKKEAETIVRAPAVGSSVHSPEIAHDKKTKITNVDVVNRSMDRTQMTFGVEYEYKDSLSEPTLGVDVLRESEPEVAAYFASRPVEIGKSRRNFVLVPVKFQPSAGVAQSGDFATDKVMIYLADKSAHRYNIFPATMLLRWRGAGAARPSAALASENLVEIDDFKQNDPASGYVSVRYNLLPAKGKLRAKIYDARTPATAEYFTSSVPEISSGSGTQLLEMRIDSDAKSPSDLVRADTIEIELVDGAGRVLARTSKQAAMVWTRPK